LKDREVYTIKSFRKGVILCLKITIILGIVFSIIFKQFTIEGISISFAISAMYSFGIGFGLGFINEYLSSKWDWIEQTNQRVTMGIIATIVYTVPVILLIDYVIFIYIQGQSTEGFFTGTMFWIHLFYVIVSLAVATFLHARDFMRNWKAAAGKESTKQKIIAGTASAQFNALKNQLDPHFLFNSLNVLTSLIDENPDAAQNFTTALSKVYRYVLEQKNKELVSVDEELEFAKTYVRLLKMRFEDSIVFEIPEKASNSEAKVVPLSLQLLLENAVKHNIVNAANPLHIKIYEKEGNLIVENNLQSKKVLRKGSGVGLMNIQQRYNLLTMRKVNINKTTSAFIVQLPMLTKQSSVMRTISAKKTGNSSYLRARKRVDKLKEFYSGLIAYVIVIPFLIFINMNTFRGVHWFWFPLLGWGMGLAFQAYEVYGKNKYFGKSWEEKKMQEFMDEETEKRSRWE